MQFVYPAFLFGLLSLAIPVIIHLFNFRRYQKVLFSNVQFLKNIEQKQASGKNLKNRLILLARLLSLFFLVLAFAKPYRVNSIAASQQAQQCVSIFIDNSYSMQNLNREGSLLDEAKLKAKQIALAYSLNTRFQLLTQDFDSAQQRLLNRDEFISGLDNVKISAQSRSLGQIVARQKGLLNAQTGAAKQVYIVSDFQKNLLTNTKIKADSLIPVNLVRLHTELLPNLAVDSVWMLSAVHRPGESEQLILRLHNYSDEQALHVPLKLLINHTQKALASYTLKAREIQTDTLSFSGLLPGWQQAELLLQDNPVTFDNRFCFAFHVKEQMPVLLIGSNVPDKYLSALYHSDAFFNATLVNEGSINYTGLSAYPCVVLSDIASLSTGLIQQLQLYVNSGGSLVVFPADEADFASYRALLQPLGAASLEKLISDKTKVVSADWQSEVFKNTFEQTPQNTAFPVVNKYYQLTDPTQSSGEKLLELPGKKVFFGRYSSGKGRVYVCAVPLSDDYSNLQRHALFVPLMLRITLLSGKAPALFYTIGSDEIAESPISHVSDKTPLKLYHDNEVIIPDVRQKGGKDLLYFADEVNGPGFYQLKMPDSLVSVLAFNSSSSESDLSYATDAELKSAVNNSRIIDQAANMPLNQLLANTNNGTELWKLCIILALMSIAAEIVLIKFYKPQNKVAPVRV